MWEIRINNLGQNKEQIFESNARKAGSSFDILLKEAIGRLEQIQSEADRAVKELAKG